MIVLTSVHTDKKYYVDPGDTFTLRITDAAGHHVVISEEITEKKCIDFIATFRFALEDGRCPGFHLTGIFASQSELPEEIRNAKQMSDLSPRQLENFLVTAGTKINNEAGNEG